MLDFLGLIWYDIVNEREKNNNEQKTNTKQRLLKSYDELLNDKYKVTLNKKTIERVKNYFQW